MPFLHLYLFGPWAALSFATAITCGFIEMTRPALHSLNLETSLIEEWMQGRTVL